MTMYLDEVLITLFVFILYGLIGGFIIVPFRHKLSFPVLASPMAGMLFWAMSGFLVYQATGLSFKLTISLIGIVCAVITISSLIYIRPKFHWQDSIFVITLTTIIVAIVSYLNNYTSIKLGHSGFLYLDGSDHLGYAAMADWLVNHRANDLPAESPQLPYQSFPNILANTDSRFGSFFSLGIISSLLGLSSTFSYDNACAIVLLTSYLGIAAVFARSRLGIILLSLTALTGFWFPLGRSGYLGKILGFPAMIFVVGLFLAQTRLIKENQSSFNILMLAVIFTMTFSAAMLYPGSVIGYFLIIFSFVFCINHLLINAAYKDIIKLFILRDHGVILAIMIITAFATLGALSLPKPGYFNFGGDFVLNWRTVLLYQLDLRGLVGSPFKWYSENFALFFLLIAVLINFIFLLISLMKRSVAAAALSGTALFLFIVPFFLAKKWTAYELSSIIYVVTICGAIWLLDDIKEKLSGTKNLFKNSKHGFMLTGLFVLVMLAISLRIPAFFGSVDRYASKNTISSRLFSKNEFDRLAHIIGNQSVIIDVPNVMYALPLLVEYGRKNMKLQWSPTSWRDIVGYRQWPSPKIAVSHLVLGLNPDIIATLDKKPAAIHCNLITRTIQYQLLNCPYLKISDLPWTYHELKRA